MGILVKKDEDIDFCPWDNPNWPAGLTPFTAIISFSGILKDPTYPAGWPSMNGIFRLPQINSTMWYLDANYINTLLEITSSRIRIMHAYFDHYAFLADLADVNIRNFDNEITIFSDGYKDGHAGLTFESELRELADDAGVLDEGKTFAEPVGRYVRLANQTDHTTIYIERE